MADRHVVKMILESAQLLSTAHRILDGEMQVKQRLVSGTLEQPKYRKHKVWILPDERQDLMYLATHANHPSAIWVRERVENYLWLVDHFFGLMDEYTFRYGKQHATKKIGYYLQSPPFNLKEHEFTQPPSAMDSKYIISNDPVINYRNYYKHGKAHLHKWTKREQPEWMV
jgi:predicted DNA-binding protein